MELPEDIVRKVKTDFKEDTSKAVHHLIAFKNKLQGPHVRILRAALKNANGDIRQLKFELNSANIDWRDTIASAETYSFECDEEFKFDKKMD